jgi:CheY-like chemotaxis protein
MASRQQKQILFVEDDVDTLEATVALLECLGYSVKAEREGLKALRTFSEEPNLFDLAVLDYKLPDLTGLELAHRIRRIRPGFPVVLYTGYFDKPSTEEVEAAAIGGRIVIKPATRKELSGVLQEALHEWAKSKGKP